MTVGDETASTVSGATRLPRLTVNTLSCESTHVPATSPVTHGLGLPVAVLTTRGVPKSPATGSGIFGQFGSTSKAGTLGLLGGTAWICEVHRLMPAAAASASVPAYRYGFPFMAFSSCYRLRALGNAVLALRSCAPFA